ncbi:hypothetical protein HPB50_016668 [Hyalomma asiaticum]|uniref:Uncharacterized protein n=1 Tax=Hyalomma asiaticum TaxID=266040 RepID=A0ACB7RU34_HYAAI|nr:hypothetical protein HPB50_016668 [Hyalomma asiaticum]
MLLIPPQGAVLSPLLFNIAMMKLPRALAEVEGIYHAIYADDITLWTNRGSLGEIEECLQQAASIVDAYAAQCGLQCAPSKSEFLHIRANIKDRTTLNLTDMEGLPSVANGGWYGDIGMVGGRLRASSCGCGGGAIGGWQYGVTVGGLRTAAAYVMGWCS